jgi:hypothetical protein
MSYSSRDREFSPRIIDEHRCTERDGLDGRCQLVRDHSGQHVLQRDGQQLAWPIDAQPHPEPPWAIGGFPRDETQRQNPRMP